MVVKCHHYGLLSNFMVVMVYKTVCLELLDRKKDKNTLQKL